MPAWLKNDSNVAQGHISRDAAGHTTSETSGRHGNTRKRFSKRSAHVNKVREELVIRDMTCEAGCTDCLQFTPIADTKAIHPRYHVVLPQKESVTTGISSKVSATKNSLALASRRQLGRLRSHHRRSVTSEDSNLTELVALGLLKISDPQNIAVPAVGEIIDDEFILGRSSSSEAKIATSLVNSRFDSRSVSSSPLSFGSEATTLLDGGTSYDPATPTEPDQELTIKLPLNYDIALSRDVTERFERPERSSYVSAIDIDLIYQYETTSPSDETIGKSDPPLREASVEMHHNEPAENLVDICADTIMHKEKATNLLNATEVASNFTANYADAQEHKLGSSECRNDQNAQQSISDLTHHVHTEDSIGQPNSCMREHVGHKRKQGDVRYSGQTTTSKHKSGKGRPTENMQNRGKQPSEDSEASDEDDTPSKKHKPQLLDEDRVLRLFACPYAKHDPRRYSMRNLNRDEKNYRNCSHSLVENISRLKQHLIRTHWQPENHCRRCFTTFKSLRDLDAHLSEAVGCVPRECPFPEKMDKQKQERIHKKRPLAPLDEQWYDIYRILFPGSPVPDSPYVEDSELSPSPPMTPKTTTPDEALRMVCQMFNTSISLQESQGVLSRQQCDIVRHDLQNAVNAVKSSLCMDDASPSDHHNSLTVPMVLDLYQSYGQVSDTHPTQSTPLSRTLSAPHEQVSESIQQDQAPAWMPSIEQNVSMSNHFTGPTTLHSVANLLPHCNEITRHHMVTEDDEGISMQSGVLADYDSYTFTPYTASNACNTDIRTSDENYILSNFGPDVVVGNHFDDGKQSFATAEGKWKIEPRPSSDYNYASTSRVRAIRTNKDAVGESSRYHRTPRPTIDSGYDSYLTRKSRSSAMPSVVCEDATVFGAVERPDGHMTFTESFGLLQNHDLSQDQIDYGPDFMGTPF